MIFDWDKLIRLLLPTFLRRAVLIELLKTLVSPLTTMHTAFLAWYEKARYKANATASVISLTHNINREFGTIATITELDGKPLDFLVTTVDVVDEMRLRALINDYKLAGKSFTLSVGNVVFTSGWNDWVCEDMIAIFTSEFTDWVCEDDHEFTITGNLIRMTMPTDWTITMAANKMVTSELTIVGTVIKRNIHTGEETIYTTFTCVIPNSEKEGLTNIANGNSDDYYYINAVVITPSSDSYYNYTYHG
jgi:hypothetical protein